jgi:hypothetical protein
MLEHSQMKGTLMSKRNLRIVLLAFSFVFTVAPAQAQGPGGPPGTGSAQALSTRVAALEARVAKLEGQITAGDLVGTYVLHAFQTELHGRNPDLATYVSSYVFQGTFVLNADGTGTIGSSGGQFGHSLRFFITESSPQTPTRTVINEPGGGGSFNWSYANGLINIGFGNFSVTAGGRVLVGSGTNPADGTTVLLIMTRLQ